jgi:hypothetical protein
MEDTLGIRSLSKALVASQTSCCVGRFGGPVARAAGLLRDIQRDVPRNLQRTAEIGSGNFGTDCDDCANMAPIPMLIMLASSSFTAVKLNLERLHLKQKSPSFAALHVQFQSYTVNCPTTPLLRNCQRGSKCLRKAWEPYAISAMQAAAATGSSPVRLVRTVILT